MRKLSRGKIQYSIGHQNSHCGKSFDDDKIAVTGNKSGTMRAGRWRDAVHVVLAHDRSAERDCNAHGAVEP